MQLCGLKIIHHSKAYKKAQRSKCPAALIMFGSELLLCYSTAVVI